MPKCKNYDGYYTGKEPSPRGIGYHAQAEEVGAERIGKNCKVWHVVEFGLGKIKRWRLGQSGASKYVYHNQVLEIEAHEPGLGLLHPNTNPYKETSWSPYHFEVVDPTHIKIVENEIDIPIRPMLVLDFVELYKKKYGIE